MEWWLWTMPLLAGVVSAVFAGIVLQARARSGVNRSLAALLLLEGIAQLTIGGVLFFTPSDHPIDEAAPNLGAAIADLSRTATVPLLTGAYLVFLGTLATPITRWLRHRAASVVVLVAFAALGVYGAWQSWLSYRTRVVFDVGIVYSSYALVGLFGLVATLLYLRRTAAGSAERRKAKAFALAFGLHDAVTVLGFFSFALAAEPFAIYVPLTTTGTVLFVALLAYALLRTQLFDVDLRVKWGISRGTVAGIILVTVFVLAKIVESYLNRTAGFVAGSVVAGMMLFLVPKLNKVGEKVANTALPQVQPTSEYLAFKKLEVYKAAIEAAQETGGITEKDRASLDRLRAKLGLSEADAQALEAEIAPLAST